MIRAELSLMRAEMERELTTAKETFKTQLQMEFTVSSQNWVSAGIDLARTLWTKELELERAEMEKERAKTKEEYKN